MPLIVQNDQGTVPDANAYIDEAWFAEYCADRFKTIPADMNVAGCIVQASDFIDIRFNYKGRRLQLDQPTEFPRLELTDRSGRTLYGIPQQVKRATAEYALLAAAGPLMPTPTPFEGGYAVESISEKVAEISRTIKYAAGGGKVTVPSYPAVDNILLMAGLTISSRRTVRA